MAIALLAHASGPALASTLGWRGGRDWVCAPAVVAPRVPAPSLARSTAVASTAAPSSIVAPAPRVTPVVGGRKTLAHRTVPASPTSRPSTAAALGRKRSRETAGIEAVPAQSAAAERAAVQRPRKRTLFTSSEGRGEEEAPFATVSEALPVIDVVIVEEEATVEVPSMMETAAALMVAEEVGGATVEEAAAADEGAEAQDVEMAPAEVPSAEEAAEGATEEIAEEIAEEAPEGSAEEAAEGSAEEAADEGGEEANEEAAEEVTDEAAEEPAVDVPSGPLTSAPRRPSGISFRSPPQSSPPLAMVAATMPPMPPLQDSTVVAEPVMTRATVVSVPSLLRTTSAVMTDLSLPEATSSDDLEELYASLHEEGGSSASAPLDEDSKTVIEQLREFLLLDVRPRGWPRGARSNRIWR
ncbi:fibrous sheath CABYR-binding protein-like [Prunus avium]|uniref:Fibrous sheath CABYR-binding protein-like n=1 Tax=Prunus avium TaxID=42229 RepID=A0A6P5THI3_PRUAV|nr:fibrous sheath CABYR-binding protein-like [Prunus avium]